MMTTHSRDFKPKPAGFAHCTNANPRESRNNRRIPAKPKSVQASSIELNITNFSLLFAERKRAFNKNYSCHYQLSSTRHIFRWLQQTESGLNNGKNAIPIVQPTAPKQQQQQHLSDPTTLGELAAELSETKYTSLTVLKFLTSFPNLPCQASLSTSRV